MTIKLHCFGESGNAYKAALALQLSGLDWEPVKVDFFGGETRTPEYRASVNAMGEAPVMIDGGSAPDPIGCNSGLRVRKIRQVWRQLDNAERREILRWVLWDNHKLSSMAGVTRFLMNFLPADKRPADVIACMRSHRCDSSALTLNAIKARNNLDGHAVEDVIWGCDPVTNRADAWHAAVLAYLDESIPRPCAQPVL